MADTQSTPATALDPWVIFFAEARRLAEIARARRNAANLKQAREGVSTHVASDSRQ